MKPDTVVPAEDPMYPSSDGLPLAENDWQLTAIHDAFGALNIRYLDQPDVYVSADLLIYYEEGDPRKSVAPDVFVVFGAAKRKRMVYKLLGGAEGAGFRAGGRVGEHLARGPGVESARCTRNWGCAEYWLFDPRDEFFDPVLQGLGLRGRAYRPMPARVESGARMIRSEVLGLDLFVEDQSLRFRDPESGDCLQNLVEATRAMGRTASALAEEKAARRVAEARVAELEARLREP